MNLYAILRRDGFTDGAELEDAAARSTEVCDDMPDDIKWIRSYVLSESDGALEQSASTRQAVKRLFESTLRKLTCQCPISWLLLTR